MSSANRASTTSSAHSAATLVYRDISPQLDERPTRPPNYEHEARALSLLAREMAENPRNILQCFVEIAVYLCDAGAAGINLLDGDLFRWVAVTGALLRLAAERCRAIRARAEVASIGTRRN